MDHEMWYDQEKQIIHLKFTRDFLTSDVEGIRKGLSEVGDSIPYRQLIIHSNLSYKIENRETREKSSELLRDFKISHVAFVGVSAANRMIAKVMLKTGVIKIEGDFFKTLEEAENWIINKR
ncbi:hypothetical protein SLH46_16585 [Draconibacterium sp. IB214405]|uniref:hypothetical protein n=1 Tax=Draconibacterium sp. IB214405 TaxID=3097352 RepID=UPI002A0AC4BE|nr:hypothetical protein [Draconibacterium sp. IB214405]MDX8340816.1 hypothetical protein [Draconibacterium sp. IB214405]